MKDPYVFKIQRYSIHDGPGIRTTIFFQGCPLSCPWCHNPESQKMPGKMALKDMDMIVAEIMEEIEKDIIFYDDSGGGVTFSGGEPLSQPELLLRLLDKSREKEIHTCLDTSGYADPNLLLKVQEKTDLVLYDIKLVGEAAHKAVTGKPVFPVLNNLKQLSERKANVSIRFPLIPEITDTKENINSMIFFLINHTCFRDIHILPFHRAGEGKYAALNMKNHMENKKPPSEIRVVELKTQFEAHGFNVTLGG